MAAMTLTKSGEMKQDVYWTLKTKDSWGFTAEVKGESRKCQPVTTKSCDFEEWKNAKAQADRVANLRKIYSFTWDDNEKVLGRRINDEVELFEEDTMEYLKEGMEAKGLTVRMYIPEATEVRKFPRLDYKAIMGDSDKTDRKTLHREIIKNLGNHIAEWELENGLKSIDYGILAEACATPKVLGVVRLDEQKFKEIEEGVSENIILKDLFGIHDQKCKIIGYVRDSMPAFQCGEEVTKSFFDGIGRPNHKVRFMDKIEEGEKARQETLKAEKKVAKKHRRNGTMSTTTSPSEMSFATTQSQSQESDETVKERQREKKRAKNQARQARKKDQARKDEDAVEEATTTLTTTTTDEQKNGNEGPMFHFFGPGTKLFFFNHQNAETASEQKDEPEDAGRITDGDDVKLEDLTLEDSASDESEEPSKEAEDAGMVNVVYAKDTSALHDAYHKGHNVWLVSEAEDVSSVLEILQHQNNE